jgi:O-antigen ligase
LLFTLSVIVSAIINTTVTDHFIQAFVWIRFPLFFLFVVYLFNTFPEKFRYFLLINLLALLVYLSFNLYESFFDLKARFEIPFDNPISGVYFARVSMPLILIAFILLNNQKRIISHRSLLVLFICILLVFAMFMTGHRNGFIGLALGVSLVTALSSLRFKGLFLVVLSVSLGMMFGFIVKSSYSDHYTKKVLAHKTLYMNVYERGIKYFVDKPIFGHGPKQVEKSELYIESVRGPNHPHNHYIQAFSELGILGGFAYIALVLSLLFKFYTLRQTDNKFWLASFVTLIIFFSPIFQTHDLWSAQFNGFTWYAIGFCYFISRNNNLLDENTFQLKSKF